MEVRSGSQRLMLRGMRIVPRVFILFLLGWNGCLYSVSGCGHVADGVPGFYELLVYGGAGVGSDEGGEPATVFFSFG